MIYFSIGELRKKKYLGQTISLLSFSTPQPEKNSWNTSKSYGSWEVFFLCSPDCPKQPRTSFPFYKFFYPIISAKVSGSQCCTKLVIVYKSELCTPKPANIWSNNDTTVTDYCRHDKPWENLSTFKFSIIPISSGM